ncbi:hypothetical protein [Achromobacter piechaudii]|uniref:hypothetical protein n=1 Tax=Achromobacter piechaudii TaxID=72556 RepID=UPI003DA7D8D4
MNAYAKFIAYAVVLSIVGFFLAVGLMTVTVAPTSSAFAPVNSADAAGWVQAIGSIAAIVAAFLIGAKQARDARDAALELYKLDRKRIEEGCRAIVSQMRTEVDFILHCATHKAVAELQGIWTSYLRQAGKCALHAFDSMPLHELGGADAVRHAFGIRSEFENLVVFLDKELGALVLTKRTENPEAALINDKFELEVLTTLCATINRAKDRIEGLYEKFAATPSLAAVSDAECKKAAKS